MKKVMSIICIVIGIVVIGIGFNVGKMSDSIEEYEIKTKKSSTQELYSTVFKSIDYDIPGYSFGADFYTEVYNALDTIVAELSDVVYANKLMLDSQYDTMENVTDAMTIVNNNIIDQSKTIIKIAKYISICIGLAIIALGLLGLGSTIELNNNKKSKTIDLEKIDAGDTNKRVEENITTNVEATETVVLNESEDSSVE